MYESGAFVQRERHMGVFSFLEFVGQWEHTGTGAL